MLNGQQILITRFEKGCLKIDGKPKFLNEKCTFLGVLLLLTLLLVGAGIQMRLTVLCETKRNETKRNGTLRNGTLRPEPTKDSAE